MDPVGINCQQNVWNVKERAYWQRKRRTTSWNKTRRDIVDGKTEK